VVLPLDILEKVNMAIIQAQCGQVLFEEWGLDEKIKIGKGVTCLFAGPPGTGKTLTAEAFVGELGKKMLLVRGNDIVNPLYGASEKFAARVFKTAKENDAVLVFDEADSYFYTRHAYARHTTDQSDYRIVNVFLSCLERHELPVILTSNRAGALDPALERRLAVKIIFDVPEYPERAGIWRLLLDGNIPLSQDVDIERLAKDYPLTGGQIKNAVINACNKALSRSINVSVHFRIN